MPQIDLSFSIVGNEIPADHGYALFSALNRIIPELHSHSGIGIHPIRGKYVGNRTLMLGRESRLTLRLNVDEIAKVLPLSGENIHIHGSELRIGVPKVLTLKPTVNLQSRMVTIKGFMEPDAFKGAVQRQLDDFEISPQDIQILKKRSLCIQDKRVVGYQTFLIGLTADESIRLQENGLGGRRRFGCGVFLPLKG